MKNRKENDPKLVWIEPPKDDETYLDVALNTLGMLNEFHLSISDMAKVLKCDRQWILKHVKDNVEHIFLNKDFRKFLKIIATQRQINLESNLKDYYYFSERDFYKWIKNNTFITRQTIRINILNYCLDVEKFLREQKINNELIEKAQSFHEVNYLTIRRDEILLSTLNEEGKKLFNSRVNNTHRKEEFIDVTDLEELPKEFISIKEIKNLIDKSYEIVYRELYSYGALKYTIDNSLVRYDSNYSIGFKSNKNEVYITIPYKR